MGWRDMRAAPKDFGKKHAPLVEGTCIFNTSCHPEKPNKPHNLQGSMATVLLIAGRTCFASPTHSHP